MFIWVCIYLFAFWSTGHPQYWTMMMSWQCNVLLMLFDPLNPPKHYFRQSKPPLCQQLSVRALSPLAGQCALPHHKTYSRMVWHEQRLRTGGVDQASKFPRFQFNLTFRSTSDPLSPYFAIHRTQRICNQHPLARYHRYTTQRSCFLTGNSLLWSTMGIPWIVIFFQTCLISSLSCSLVP